MYDITTSKSKLDYVFTAPEVINPKFNKEFRKSIPPLQTLNEKSTLMNIHTIQTTTGPINSSWPMFCHDNQHTGLSPYNTASNPGVEKWRLKTEGSVDGGIAIGPDGLLYFGDFHGDVYAVYPNGTIKWTHQAGMIFTSTPCIGMDGTIYIGTFTEELVAINPDGTRKWATHVGDEVASSPAIAEDGTIYVGVMGPGNDKGRIVALNPNGTIRWYYDTGFWIVSDPAIHQDGAIIIGSGDGGIYALHPNGTLRWKYNTGNDVKGSASIDDDGIIYIATYVDNVLAFYPNGTLKWSSDIGHGTETNPCFGPDGTIYVAYDGVYALNPENGSIKWKFPFLGDDEKAYLSSPAISADGIIYIGVEVSNEPLGSIYSINPNGTLRWRKYIANQAVYSSPAIGDDGSIYIGAWSRDGLNGGIGTVHAFNEKTINYPPDPPSIKFEGVKKLRFTPLPFSFRATDPDHSPLEFYVDWGDGTTSTKDKEYAPNEIEVFEHTYIQKGPFTIRAKARDIFGLESDWGYFELNMPVTYSYPALNWLSNYFPLFEYVLRLITTQTF